MRGITYIAISFMMAAYITYAVFMKGVHTSADVLIVATFMLFSMIGSIAPDADIKGSLVRAVIFWGFFVPYLVLVITPLRIILKKDHRGSVLHSVIAIIWSAAVVYLITAYQFEYLAMAAVMGFVMGYVLHLFGDGIAPTQSVEIKSIKDTTPQN